MGRDFRVFILEDRTERMSKFQRALIGVPFDHAADAATAKELLSSEKYDLIFLDHDLGGDEFVSSDDPNTGYQVAKFIPETPNALTPAVIHSCNPGGAQNMQGVLPHAVIVPFPSLDVVKMVDMAKEIDEFVAGSGEEPPERGVDRDVPL